MRLGTPVLTAILALLAMPVAAAADTLTQLAAPNGCLHATAFVGCTTAAAAAQPTAVLVRDSHAYVADGSSSRVWILDRNPTTGALAPRGAGPDGCIGETGAGGCVDGRALGGAAQLAISPDGTKLYVLSASAGVAVLDRNPVTGALSQSAAQPACVTVSGAGGACNAAPALGDTVGDLTVSPDGADVYVVGTSSDNNGTVSDLHVVAGGLEARAGAGGCVRDNPAGTGCADGRALLGPYSVRVSGDGRFVYVTNYASASVVGLTRAADGGLTPIAGPDGCFQSAGSGDGCREDSRLGTQTAALAVAGDDVYAGARNGTVLSHLRRDAVTGGLAYADCVSPSGPVCTHGADLFGGSPLVVAPDGNHVYLGALYGRGLVGFARAAGGALTPDPTPGGCLATGGNNTTTACTLPVGFAHSYDSEFGAGGVALSGDGRFVYAASPGYIEDGTGLVVAQRPTAPICRGAAVQVVQGATADLPLDCTDADGDPLALAIVSGPDKGTLGAIDQAARTVRFTAPAQTGATTLTFRAR